MMIVRALPVVALLALHIGCTGDLGDEAASQTSGAGAGSTTSSQGVGASAPAGSGGAGSGGAGVGGDGGSGGGPGETICARWNDARADLSEGSWSGNVGTCNPGDVSADGRDRALALVNLYRFLAGLPEVTHDPTRNALAQACALLMHANGELSHDPPSDWQCYGADGAEGAGKSNIASTPGVVAVDLYMADPGNATTIGHRRWILSRSLGPIGLGSTDGFSCMWVLGGSGSSSAPWVAFPSPGPFPVEAMTASWASVDETGWTLQSDSIDLGGAEVSISDGGQELPVAVVSLAGGYGSTHAIKITPDGWTSQAGQTYQVSVTGIGQPIAYAVEMIACE
jgi:hypothetical protein